MLGSKYTVARFRSAMAQLWHHSDMTSTRCNVDVRNSISALCGPTEADIDEVAWGRPGSARSPTSDRVAAVARQARLESVTRFVSPARSAAIWDAPTTRRRATE